MATPESVGISSERLGRLHRGMQAIVDRHEAGGIVTLIAREGKIVDVHASGFQDAESRTPMRPDTIFRIASMSKPVTSVAVMMLYEEGKLLLTDPVSKFIPAFKTLKEAVDKLAGEPLVSQPGAAWNYSLSTDVLGRVVEVVSGQSFDGCVYFAILPAVMPETREYDAPTAPTMHDCRVSPTNSRIR